MKQITILALVLIGMFSASETHALSCLPSPGPEVEFQEAKAVFIGEATAVFNNDNFDYSTKNFAKFKVTEVYKGDLPSELTVETDGTWGMRFEAGKKYLVYLDQLEPYEVALCRFGTASLEDPQTWDRIQEIEAKGNEPRTPPQQESNSEKYLWGWPHKKIVLLEWAGAAILIAAGYFLIKKYY